MPDPSPDPATPLNAAVTAASTQLRQWLTDPDWPQNPRIWTPTMPDHIRHTLAHLSQQTNTPLLLIQVDFRTYTATVTKL